MATDSIAQAAPQVSGGTTLTIRNNRFFTGLLFLFDLAIWVMMAACIYEAYKRYYPLPSFDAQFAKGLVIGLLWLGISYLCATYLWEFSMRLNYNHVVLDGTGAHFYMRGNGKLGEFSFNWGEIKSITRTRLSNTMCYTILGTDGESYAVTSYVFWRPGYVAKQISQRSGVAIKEG